MLFVVIAKDGTDAGAQARRGEARASHLETARALQAAGRLVTGGALLDAEQNMIGSMLVLDVANEAEARRLVEEDVYTRTGVWQSYEVWPYRQAL